jgi:hypothetical protein
MNQPTAQVPEILLQELHRATEQFHQCKIDLEKAMEGSEYRHQERIDDAEACLREAEHAVEEVEERIKQALRSHP